VSRGCYALSDASQVRIAEVAWGGIATCVTALQQLGLPLLSRDSRIHLAFDSHRSFSGRNSKPPRSVVRHFGSALPLRRHLPAEAVDAAGLCLPSAAHLVSVDAALNRGVISMEDVKSFSISGTTRRSWLLKRADPLCQSPLETLTRVELIRNRIPFETQVSLPGIGRVDFLVAGRLVVEVDGRSYHSDERAFAEDRRRDRAAVLAGYRVLRFASSDVFSSAQRVVSEIRCALETDVRRGGSRRDTSNVPMSRFSALHLVFPSTNPSPSSLRRDFGTTGGS